MRIRGVGRIQNSIRTIQNRCGATGVILLYHRIADFCSDPQRLAVSPANFSEQMQVLADVTCPVPLDTLSDRLKTRKRADRPLSVVTFDDGYADNLDHAAPCLIQHEIPATVFVATVGIHRSHEFYWDALERILLRPDVPDVLSLEIGSKTQVWSLTGPPWSTVSGGILPPFSRGSWLAYSEILRLVMNLPPGEREAVLDRLFVWSGISRNPLPVHRVMTEEELCKLTANELISVGAHTVNHPVLAVLRREEQAREIMASRVRLEQILCRPITTFSYPYGRVEDYSRQTVRLVREAGFTCACSNFPRLVSRWTDPFQLPRFIAGNQCGELFEKSLAEFLQTWC